VFSFPPALAPTKVLIVPLSSNEVFIPYITKISQKLRIAGISYRVDDSGASIGKRYARNDELGTPLAITLDFQTITDHTITLRERDSTRQVRGSEDRVLTAIQSIIYGTQTWPDIEKDLPVFKGQEI
jgi:glycyl-tRNA synthetase